MENKTISELAAKKSGMHGHHHHHHKNNGDDWGWGYGWANTFIWFVIIAVIIWFILYSTKPQFVRKTDSAGNTIDEVDNGKALVWSIVISFIIVILIRIFWYSGW